MNVQELIDKLKEFDPNLPVRLFDHRKCMHFDSGDGSYAGVYDEMEISIYDIEGEDERAFFKEQHGTDYKPWLAISFENDDYEE